MFMPLTRGGSVILAENALALPQLAAANEVTLINTVPSAIRELLRIKGVPPSVRVVNLAGEPLTTSLVNQIYAESRVTKVYDLYGPSETTTYSTVALLPRGDRRPPSIGRHQAPHAATESSSEPADHSHLPAFLLRPVRARG
jgi:microcystin synthetase protein McyA